ncbi:hypothetical protein GQ42DRAFT_114575, partial [Ramicandelaber brevisporus]
SVIAVQILQTLAILVESVKTQTFMHYLLSNNYVNRIMMAPLDFSNEEIVAYYVTLLKAVALSLNSESLTYLFDRSNMDVDDEPFPLFTRSIRFFEHEDAMVRIAVRTITLSIFKL